MRVSLMQYRTTRARGLAPGAVTVALALLSGTACAAIPDEDPRGGAMAMLFATELMEE